MVTDYENLENHYMLLRPLPLYAKGEIRTLKSWLGILSIQPIKFYELVEEGWFK